MSHQQSVRIHIVDLLTALAVIVIISLAAISLLLRPSPPAPYAISQVSAQDMGEQFLNLMAGRIESDWSELKAIPDQPDTTKNESDQIFSQHPLFGYSNPMVYFTAPAKDFPWDPRFCTKGLFKIEHTNYQNDIDFSGYIRAWKERISAPSAKSAPVLIDLNIELSWPGDRPYEERSTLNKKLRLVRPGTTDPGQNTLMNLPCKSVWGIEVLEAPTLFYYTINSSEMTFIGEEGELLNLPNGDVEGLTCSPSGIYVVYRSPFGLNAELYLIPRGQIDGNAHTSLLPTRIGSIELLDIRLAGIQFVDGKLWGIGETSGQIYLINQLTGACKTVAHLSIPGIQVGAVTLDADHRVLLAADTQTGTTIYTFSTFPKGELTATMTIKGSKVVSCMAAYPTGVVYLYDGSTLWEAYPNKGTYHKHSHFISSMTDMDFFYQHERDYCMDLPINHVPEPLSDESSQ